MKKLRQIIRSIIVESEIPWSETPEGKEWAKYHDIDRANAAIQELASTFQDAYSFDVGSWSNQFTVYEMNYEPEPGCIVRIRVYQMYGQVILDEIETTPQCEGKGYARQAIQIIKDVVKKHSISISLEAKAFHTDKGKGRMSSSQLESWYESQGFEKAKNNRMEYKP